MCSILKVNLSLFNLYRNIRASLRTLNICTLRSEIACITLPWFLMHCVFCQSGLCERHNCAIPDLIFHHVNVILMVILPPSFGNWCVKVCQAFEGTVCPFFLGLPTRLFWYSKGRIESFLRVACLNGSEFSDRTMCASILFCCVWIYVP